MPIWRTIDPAAPRRTEETAVHDALGNHVTTQSSEAARLLDTAIDLHAHGWPGALDAAESATREDPDLAIAHALQGLIHAMWGRRAAAEAAMSRAMSLAAGTSRRERSLVELLHHVVGGRNAAALAWLLVHLRQFPADLLALTTGMGAYGLLAFSGRDDHNEVRLDLLDALEPSFPPDYPWLLANRGWARIETGAVDEGLAMARHAIAIRPRNAHNAHIVAHGLHEANRPAEYLDFTAEWLQQYPDDALMWGHLHWHAALAELALERQDDALHRCVVSIMPYLSRGTPYMTIIDAASLLWRLGLRGVPNLPWPAAFEHASRYFPEGSNPFAELHLAMLAGARQDAPALTACRERLERLGAGGSFGAQAAIEWTLALQDLLQGNEEAANAHFEACQAHAVRLGGSGAQRNVIAKTRQAARVPVA
jgi:tetratricopeptide (TPR) repeat protein